MVLCKTNTLFHLLHRLFFSPHSRFLYTLYITLSLCFSVYHLFIYFTVVFYHLTCCLLLAMGGSTGLQQGLLLIHGDPRVPGKLGAVGTGGLKRQAPSLEASLVGAWYLTCLSSSSISWGSGLNGELKTPGHWRKRERVGELEKERERKRERERERKRKRDVHV